MATHKQILDTADRMRGARMEFVVNNETFEHDNFGGHFVHCAERELLIAAHEARTEEVRRQRRAKRQR